MEDSRLNELVNMSRRLGEPGLDYVILGEGNTSSRIDDHTFWVKASGEELGTADGSSFVKVRFDKASALLELDKARDEDIRAGLEVAKADPNQAARPSVETVLHAVALQLEGIEFVGHTHPTAVNSLTCSNVFDEVVKGRLFPDEIVVCGPAPVVVPYTDPGIVLARKVRDLINAFIEERQELPKTIYMQNHGLIVLGRSPRQVLDITAMAVKRARVIIGACAVGRPHFLSSSDVDRIHTRPDEAYRREVLASERM